MEPKDLRIGNWVMGNKPFQIDFNTLGLFVTYFKSSGKSRFEPIPLTEEWLINFGFDKGGVDDMPRTLSYAFGWVTIFPSNSFCDFKGYGFMFYKPNKDKPTESARVKLKYVNQLQNLIYALTGTELETSK